MANDVTSAHGARVIVIPPPLYYAAGDRRWPRTQRGRPAGSRRPSGHPRARDPADRGSDEALSTLDRAARDAYGIEELQRIGPVAAARAEYFLLAGGPERVAVEVAPALALATTKDDHWVGEELAFRLWQATGRDEWPGSSTVDASPYRLLTAGDLGGRGDGMGGQRRPVRPDRRTLHRGQCGRR